MSTLDLQEKKSFNADMKKRPNANTIQIGDDAMLALEEILGESGIPKKVAIERLIWFLHGASFAVRGSILKTLPPDVQLDVAKIELARLANSKYKTVAEDVKLKGAMPDSEEGRKAKPRDDGRGKKKAG